ncbi:hypothetical protein CN233_32045 [Sinorhizobium meliloti]|uniref:hypothetical protein n=1 Tax=Rhizobium meliloti TaxID=382 RepID=UPI0001E4D32C|nr:hypothetical protein [Sinorhizobium meliloti]AEG52581.1 hypothetical protein Sinme_0823 [Sinorhizobium meliloti AK83]MDE4591703.1 hypothetical protein [Sinorhizobium meliloti]RVG22268.1 hypothetical protein CN233_32045 [Sinorhizobium meliloti]RVK98764.1 hypothetical protein CN152_15800 [Sinorhizobium meliloti]RVN39092.1 hypothetical protein CN113_28885 [Sinorhizobium meliloti]
MSEEFVDLSGLEALVQSQEEGIEIDILNEQAKPIGLKIRVVGPDSDRTQKAVRDVAAEFAKAAAERESLGEARDDDSDARMVAILAKATLSWSPNPKIGGSVVPFSEENVRNLYTKFRIIREQVEVRAVRRGSFTKG